MLDFRSCSMTAGNIPVLITFTFSCKQSLENKKTTQQPPSKSSKYRASSGPHPDTLFWHGFWHIIWKCIYIYIAYIYIYTYCIYICVFWHSFWHIQYSDILSDMLSGIYSDILSGILSDLCSDILSGIYFDIPSGTLSGILSGIYSDILSGIYSGILSGMCSGPGVAHSIRSRYGFQVQAWPTASGARDMEFGSRSGPLHPERAKEMKKKVHKIAE